ncbi:MAG: hypothetical protein IJX98_06935 [Clostridia bacterium]|nr:hypothetical protein [Clostridia bacterium]
MRNKSKKIISLIAAATLTVSAFGFAACSEYDSLGNQLDYESSEVKAEGNGGFVVEKGEYTYFINGQALSDAGNEYGEVEKGSLMRIKTQDLQDGKYAAVETVVPLLLVGGSMNSGIYIHGDYVYFATPTKDKDLYGNAKTGIDFKRAHLNGTQTDKEAMFYVDSSSVDYRFVEINGTVYCLYANGSNLYSYNTAENTETTLVESAAGSFMFNSTVTDDGTVYYTMNVPKADLENTDSATNESYQQIYRVRADAKVTGVNADEASYTVSNGKTYDFDKSYLERKNEEAKEANSKAEVPYDFNDYTTYPYVNLGDLVVDGVGTSEAQITVTDKYNNQAQYEAAKAAGYNEPLGYTYTLQSYENGGVYFTRTSLMPIGNEVSALYYLADATMANNWNVVSGNDHLEVVSLDLTNATASAIYYLDGGVHTYLYIDASGNLQRAVQPTVNQDGSFTQTQPLTLKSGVSGMTLLDTKGDYLYYYDGTNYLYRIDYTGAPNAYHYYDGDDEYRSVQILEIMWNSSWYAPEFVGNVLLYNNADSINSTTYNYIYAVDLAGSGKGGMKKVAEIEAWNEQYKEVNAYINGLEDSEVKAALQYYFRTGKTTLYKEVEEFYETVEKNEIEAFIAREKSENQTANDYTDMFKADNGEYYDTESYFINLLGKVSEEDQDSIDNGWVAKLRKDPDATTEEEEEFPVWAIVLISVGGGLLLIAAAVVIFIVVRKARKKALEDELRGTRKTRRKIDTTDDKTIDVYADDEATQETAENATEEAQEAVEAQAEETAENGAENAAETVETEAGGATDETPADQQE